MARRIVAKEDEKIVAKYLYKYSDFNRSKALEELKKIDLIKNNYKDKTILSYLQGVRAYLDRNVKTSGVPLGLFEECDNLRAKCYSKLVPSIKDACIRKHDLLKQQATIPIVQYKEFVPTLSETSQKTSTIKAKLDLQLKEHDAKINQYKLMIENLENEKVKAKAKVTDLLFDLLLNQ